jgi:hypothetical protein
LIATATTKTRPSSAERYFSQFAPFTGIAGALIAADATGDLAIVRQIGFAFALMLAMAALAVGIRQAIRGTHRLQVAMTIIVGLFFLPVYVYGPSGFLAVSVAHAYQYVLVMICMSASQRESLSTTFLLPVVGVTAIYLVGFYLMTVVEWGTLSRPLAVLWSSITLWHFIIDADVWRLSRPFQRQALRDSLPFLFR